MLSSKGFDLWADSYDKSVGLSDENDAYPFAGYKAILNVIYNGVLSRAERTVLDLGFGTATLTAKLYEQGCTIYGQDFSPRMIALAQAKMPRATLCAGDLTVGLAEPLRRVKYDAIIATYSLHHLSDKQKIKLLSSLPSLLNPGGCIYIGDVAFKTRHELERQKALSGDEWDDDERYFVFDELARHIPHLTFERFSPCAGLLTLQ